MRVTIEEVHGGFIVKYDESIYVYAATDTIRMLEEVGKKVYGKRVQVEEK